MSIFSVSDVADFRTDYLASAAETWFPNQNWSDPFLLAKLRAAEHDAKIQLKVLLEPTKIFPFPPTDAQITALSSMPWIEEPGYDWDPNFFSSDRWGYLVTRQHPVRAVDFIRFAYPSQDTHIFEIPANWIRLDKKYGHIRIVPSSNVLLVPLDVYLLQVIGGGRSIPSAIQVQYTAGLNDVRGTLPALFDVICKMAVIKLVQDMQPAASESISADGLSQSRSVKIGDMTDAIDRILFGPKGSNGGLYTEIHGLSTTVMGIVV